MKNENELKRGQVLVCLEDIGEGHNGDYNEDDPDDVPLLRFTVLYKGEPVDDASYCTLLPTCTDSKIKRLALNGIMNSVYDKVKSGESIKKICERLSWLEESDFKQKTKGE